MTRVSKYLPGLSLASTTRVASAARAIPVEGAFGGFQGVILEKEYE